MNIPRVWPAAVLGLVIVGGLSAAAFARSAGPHDGELTFVAEPGLHQDADRLVNDIAALDVADAVAAPKNAPPGLSAVSLPDEDTVAYVQGEFQIFSVFATTTGDLPPCDPADVPVYCLRREQLSETMAVLVYATRREAAAVEAPGVPGGDLTVEDLADFWNGEAFVLPADASWLAELAARSPTPTS